MLLANNLLVRIPSGHSMQKSPCSQGTRNTTFQRFLCWQIIRPLTANHSVLPRESPGIGSFTVAEK